MIKRENIAPLLATVGSIGILTQTFLMISLIIPTILGLLNSSLFGLFMVIVAAGCHLFIISRGHLPSIVVDSAYTGSSDFEFTKKIASTLSFKEQIEVLFPSIALLSGAVLIFGDYIALLILIHIVLAGYLVIRTKRLIQKYEVQRSIENAYD